MKHETLCGLVEVWVQEPDESEPQPLGEAARPRSSPVGSPLPMRADGLARLLGTPKTIRTSQMASAKRSLFRNGRVERLRRPRLTASGWRSNIATAAPVLQLVPN